MIPGTAIGVLVGDLLFFWLAFAWPEQDRPQSDITAMPLGLDTPSTFGMIFFVLGPAFLAAKARWPRSRHAAAIHTWHIGICAIFISGLFKLACSRRLQLDSAARSRGPACSARWRRSRWC